MIKSPNEDFRQICVENKIDPAEFPFDFVSGSVISYPDITRAMIWIMKRVMKKELSKIQGTN